MSFWTNFETALQGAIHKAEAEAQAALKYFTPMVVAGAEEVATAALTAVLQQAPLVIAGSEKLSAATASVVSTLASSGKAVGVGIAETAVQAAVNALAPAGTKGS
jgi:transketolase